MFWRRERILLQTVRENTEAFHALMLVLERMSERLDDMGQDIRANTQATLRMIDRMDRLDGGEHAA